MLEMVVAEFHDPDAAVPFHLAILRLFFAILLGGAIGWEREVYSRPAGLRTHMMVSMAACLFALLAFELMGVTDREAVQFDPLRLIEAVTAGVAFLAAGSIITSGGKVKGLTTGASMWLAGAIGLACGTGRLTLALLATILTLIVLWLLRKMADKAGLKD